jgi:NADH:ubiquinone oxidoreductase subunit 6 (subunit J)
MDDTIHIAEKTSSRKNEDVRFSLLSYPEKFLWSDKSRRNTFMEFAALIFWIFAVILVGSALMVVVLRNIVHSALALVVLFAMAAGIYVLLNAEFIALVQILVYAGAVTILILFALMLTRIQGQPRTNPTNKLWGIAVVICALVGAAIIYAATVSQRLIGNTTNIVNQVPGVNNVVAIGQLLYSPTSYSYVLPFEIASLVLLVAIVGAIIIGRED